MPWLPKTQASSLNGWSNNAPMISGKSYALQDKSKNTDFKSMLVKGKILSSWKLLIKSLKKIKDWETFSWNASKLTPTKESPVNKPWRILTSKTTNFEMQIVQIEKPHMINRNPRHKIELSRIKWYEKYYKKKLSKFKNLYLYKKMK